MIWQVAYMKNNLKRLNNILKEYLMIPVTILIFILIIYIPQQIEVRKFSLSESIQIGIMLGPYFVLLLNSYFKEKKDRRNLVFQIQSTYDKLQRAINNIL